MKKRMLALLLTLCLVLSLLPAQSVVAEGEQTTYTVTIEGNGSQFVLKQNGTAITGLVSKTTVSVPVGSSLGAEGYTVEEWDRDTQYFIAWNIAGTDLGDDAAMLNYVINSDLTFTAGWVGVGDGGSASNTIAFNADGGMFTVTTTNESWDTNGYAYPVPVNEGMGNYAAISDPWRSGHTFVGWMMGVQDENGDFTPDDNTLMTTAAALDVHADGNRLITFMAQWTEDTTGGGDSGASEGMQSVDLGTFPVGVPTTVELPVGEDPSTGLSLPGTAVATFIPASTNVYTIYRSVPSNGVYTGQQIRIYLNSQAVDLHSSWYNPEYDMAGERWELIAGNEYRIEFQGHTTDEGGITYTLNETVMPEEIYFPFETYEGYAEMGGVDKVSFKPAHAYAPVTYTVEDTSVAELASWGEVVFKQVGQTKVHAACGEMSASANVVVKPYEILELDKELKVSTGVNNYWVICRFQPAETGDYTFDFSGMGNLTVVISDNNDFTEHWVMDEGEWYPYTVALEENVEYIVRINTDYTQMEVGANVTFAGNQSGNEVPLLNVYSYDAPFTVTTANDQWDTDGYGIDEAEPGKCIGDYGITISDPVFWVPGRTFLGWTANTYEHWTDEEGNPQEGDVQIPGTSIMTTSQMMAYPARDDGKEINFVAQWDGDDSDYYSDVGFETLDGILTMQHPDGDTDETTTPGQHCKEDGTKISQQIEWTIPNNPVHPEFQFEGWLEYNEEEGMILVSETVYTTAQVFNKTVPSYNVRFVAKWDGIPMDDYKTMFQNGSGDDGEQSSANVEVNANFGEVFVHGANVSAGAHDINVEPGKSMADMGEKFDDPVYWTTRTFLGWIVTTAEELTDEEGNTYWDDVQIPGTKLMTTAEMLAYKTPADGTRIKFVAQWAGDDSDYFSDVGFETLDGILTMQHPDGGTVETTAPGQRCKEDGTKLSEQIEWSIPNNPVHPEFQFEGWLEYNEEEGMILVSETVYTTAQVFDKTVPSYNVRFVAKWDGIPMDDYKIMFQGGNDEEEPDFEISEDGTVILDATTPDASESVSSVELPVAAMEEMLAEDVKQVMIEMDSAAVIIDAAALAAIAEQAEGASITLSVEQVATTTLTEKQQAVLKDKDVDLVLTALVLSDGEPIGDFKGGSITVAVPFELPAGDNAEDYNVWYVANDGTMEKMDTSYADGMLLFITKHFSDYVVIKTTQTNEEDKDNSGIGESTPEPEDPTQPTEPKPTEPKPTEPKPTEPKPTEPKPTEPKPTEPTKPTNPAVPDTADTADIMGLMTLMLASGAMAMALWLSLRKRNAA